MSTRDVARVYSSSINTGRMMRDAFDADDLLRNNSLIYSGCLADGRGLVCYNGVYGLKVADYMAVTDDGLGIDFNSPGWWNRLAASSKHRLLDGRFNYDTSISDAQAGVPLQGDVIRAEEVAGEILWERYAIQGVVDDFAFFAANGTRPKWVALVPDVWITLTSDDANDELDIEHAEPNHADLSKLEVGGDFVINGAGGCGIRFDSKGHLEAYHNGAAWVNWP